MSAVARLNATAAPVTGPWLVSNSDSMKEPACGVKYDFATTLCHEARMGPQTGRDGQAEVRIAVGGDDGEEQVGVERRDLAVGKRRQRWVVAVHQFAGQGGRGSNQI